MKVRYDDEVDAAYIQLSSKRPKGAVEIKEGVVVHVANKDEIVGIEILNASERFPIKNLHRLQFVSY
ncbi:MAG TPA: hypothetical protein DDX89_01160 [Candidatus Omnitrophica bacterium]|nr:MAG: hypothetical protein A2Z92_02375 [Omnitrophica WOR_2 bacterium GWA2_63_20]OGX32582.1 MAG: hypothetical protein A3E56_01535 [Omnitrophica WOR_2 bacterium RIFCSPHIGHO2_12_FULL_64_13]OGX35280.1 MAG: hypothetical protein A3B73_00265 [Omnitrophica WOR_2 bacterium RIFCSPHIGHO2_02_FULL_63_39]OGX48365.1 MAG: hypothetical protein A3G88_01990 [Omnitrophica WOR_2 bacterium RIFCSPLOWO2_12_FULL_63_16]HAM40437.1 hypothetical protein [Candidatus Omnitrophota bacterium]